MSKDRIQIDGVWYVREEDDIEGYIDDTKEQARNKVASKVHLLELNKDKLMQDLLNALYDEEEISIEFAEANLHRCLKELEINEYLLKLIEND